SDHGRPEPRDHARRLRHWSSAAGGERQLRLHGETVAPGRTHPRLAHHRYLRDDRRHDAHLPSDGSVAGPGELSRARPRRARLVTRRVESPDATFSIPPLAIDRGGRSCKEGNSCDARSQTSTSRGFLSSVRVSTPASRNWVGVPSQWWCGPSTSSSLARWRSRN